MKDVVRRGGRTSVHMVGREDRRKCSEVDQPRVKQALVEQVMHATIEVYRDWYCFLM